MGVSLNNVINVGTVDPAQAQDIGMSAAGVPLIYVNGAVKPVSYIIGTSGTVTLGDGASTTITHGELTIPPTVSGVEVVGGTASIILMHGDGSNGSTTLTEENGQTVVNSGCAISTAQKVFGSGSILCSPAGDYFTVARSGFEFNDGPFTLEMRIRPTDLGAMTGGRWVVNDIQGGSTISVGIQISGSSLLLYLSSNGSSWNISSGTNCGTLTVDTWYHLVLQWDGNHYDVYLDGTRAAHIASTSGLYNTSIPLTFGKHASEAGANFVGYYDEICLRSGAAYSGTSFTVPTSPFTGEVSWESLQPGVDFSWVTTPDSGTAITNISGSSYQAQFVLRS